MPTVDLREGGGEVGVSLRGLKIYSMAQKSCDTTCLNILPVTSSCSVDSLNNFKCVIW